LIILSFLISSYFTFSIYSIEAPLCFKIFKFSNIFSAFVKLNPDWNGESEAFYVGQTSKEREERYNQHMAGEKSNKYVRKYGLKPFAKADATERLVEELAEKNIQMIPENLRYYQALYYERKLTLELRKRGYAAYSN
jgi:hypothetical protein